MGPIFLEFSTYRWREHCGPNYDNEIGYRSVEEYEKWKDIDPLKRLKNELFEKGWLNENTYEKLISSLNLKVEEAFRFAEDSPFPDQSDAYKHIFAEE